MTIVQLSQELVRTGFGDRTILTIAHRLNTIIDNDRILLMDFGHVAECGTSVTLLPLSPYDGGSFSTSLWIWEQSLLALCGRFC